MPKAAFKVGDLVWYDSGHLGSQMGVIVVVDAGGCGVRHIDYKSGKIQICPDKRCKGSSDSQDRGCVICGSFRKDYAIRHVTKDDAELFIQEGMLDRDLWLKDHRNLRK